MEIMKNNLPILLIFCLFIAILALGLFIKSTYYIVMGLVGFGVVAVYCIDTHDNDNHDNSNNILK